MLLSFSVCNANNDKKESKKTVKNTIRIKDLIDFSVEHGASKKYC